MTPMLSSLSATPAETDVVVHTPEFASFTLLRVTVWRSTDSTYITIADDTLTWLLIAIACAALGKFLNETLWWLLGKLFGPILRRISRLIWGPAVQDDDCMIAFSPAQAVCHNCADCGSFRRHMVRKRICKHCKRKCEADGWKLNLNECIVDIVDESNDPNDPNAE